MAAPYRDLYQLLGVDRDALPADIAQAYRRKARAVHPDSRPGDPAAAGDFRALAEAYRVLGDPGQRAAYDRTLPSPAPRAVRPVHPAGPPLWVTPVRVEGGPPGQDRIRLDQNRLAALAELVAWLAEDTRHRGGDWTW